MTSFKNTTRETGATLARSEKRANRQEQAILNWLERAESWVWWPPEAIQKYVLPNAPITSIRRALTNLTDEGLLEKSEHTMFKSKWGKATHGWRRRMDNGR